MIIDSHVHVWTEDTDPRRSPARWPRRELEEEASAYTLDQVDAEMTAAGVAGVVLVQSTQSLRHTDEMLRVAESAARPTKVVGWVPLDDPDRTADALRRFADRPELVGVRQWYSSETGSPSSMPAPESLALVAEAGLSLDILPWPLDLLDRVPQMAQRHPGLRIVIDLLGWPLVTAGRMQPWSDQLALAAAEPAVHVKLGGLYLNGDWHPDPETWRPYVATLTDLFGADRIMIGSNWPVMTMFGRTYTETVTMLRRSLDELIDAEREEVLAGTAARVYGFAPPE